MVKKVKYHTLNILIFINAIFCFIFILRIVLCLKI